MCSRIRWLLVFAAILVSMPAISADWQLVSVLKEKESYVTVDTSSIATVGKLKKAWFNWVYTSAQSVPAPFRNSQYPVSYLSSKSLHYFNCAERTEASIQALYNDAEGTVVGSYNWELKNVRYSEVAPDTVGELMLNAVCAPAAPVPAGFTLDRLKPVTDPAVLEQLNAHDPRP